MSFITRCPACGTAFKVVSDQLKISDGWVRCGQCQHIFDAMLDLQPWQGDAELVELSSSPSGARDEPWARDNVPASAPGHAYDFPEPASTAAAQPDQPSEPEQVDTPLPSDWPDVQEAEFETVALSEPAGPGLDRVDGPVAGHAEVWVPLEPMPALYAEPDENAPLAADASATTPEPELEHGSLAFVRRAQRRAFWRRPAVRAGLIAICAFLLLLLAAQWALWQRDVLATQVPALQPVLQTLCRPLACEVGAGRQLESLSIDSSALLRRSADRYAFDMVVKNAAAQALATPALELTLTDSSDRVLVRRVFHPNEWPQARATMAANSEWPVRLELALASADVPVVGYRAVLFYP